MHASKHRFRKALQENTTSGQHFDLSTHMLIIWFFVMIHLKRKNIPEYILTRNYYIIVFFLHSICSYAYFR